MVDVTAGYPHLTSIYRTMVREGHKYRRPPDGKPATMALEFDDWVAAIDEYKTWCKSQNKAPLSSEDIGGLNFIWFGVPIVPVPGPPQKTFQEFANV